SDQDTIVGGKQTTTVTGQISTTSKAAIVLTAATQIQLIVGGASFIMDTSGKIEIKGTDILIQGSDKVTNDAGTFSATGKQQASMASGKSIVTCDPAKLSNSAAAINSTAKGMHEVVGAVVKIN